MWCKQPTYPRPPRPGEDKYIGVNPQPTETKPKFPTRDKKPAITISINIEGKEELEQLKKTLKEIGDTLEGLIEKSNVLNSLTKSINQLCKGKGLSCPTCNKKETCIEYTDSEIDYDKLKKLVGGITCEEACKRLSEVISKKVKASRESDNGISKKV